MWRSIILYKLEAESFFNLYKLIDKISIVKTDIRKNVPQVTLYGECHWLIILTVRRESEDRAPLAYEYLDFISFYSLLFVTL